MMKPRLLFAGLVTGASLFILMNCLGREKLRGQQIDLHEAFTKYQLEILANAERIIETSLQMFLAEHTRQNSNCSTRGGVDSKGSIYIPESARRGDTLNCVLAASSVLDDYWQEEFQKAEFISWVYLYDNRTRFFRIFPKTDTDALFGKNLLFDKFNFYLGALRHFPSGSWSNTRLDVNGTGKILMYSKGTQLTGTKEFTVLGLDIRPRHVLKQFEPRLLKFANDFLVRHLFIFSYHLRESNKGLVPYQFSTNETLWHSLMPFDVSQLRLQPKETEKFARLEKDAKSRPGSLVGSDLALSGRTHFCTMVYLNALDLNTVMCSEK